MRLMVLKPLGSRVARSAGVGQVVPARLFIYGGQFRLPDLFMVVMVYPYYLHYDLPTGSALTLSWFGNKLSIQYIMNLSSANYPYIWGPNRELIFCVVVPDYINLLTILQHTRALSSESSDSTQGFTWSLYYITISSALQR